jgi:nucleotidyltransferase/DNA polymerase involved in DNA repair
MSRWVLHVDLDQFLAAVEILRNPELRGRPVVVGGDGDPTKRGVVSTASYEARALGVTSGTPLRTALKRCPDAVFLPVDRETYEAASTEVMAALRTFDVVVEELGWDEAFLGVETDDPVAFAGKVRDRVRERTRLECSVGIGKNRLQAKIATGYGKPAGVFTLTYDNWFELLGDQSVEALWGIGRRTAIRLEALDIRTVRDLAAADDEVLAPAFGPTIGPWLGRVGRGEDPTPVSGTPAPRRSRGHEVTFQRNLTDWADVRRQVAAMTQQVAAEIADDDQLVDRIVVKVRYAPFFTTIRSRVVRPPTRDVAALVAVALAVLEEKFEAGRPVRLIGVAGQFVR